MKTPKHNRYLMWVLFALLASNMSFFQPQFSGGSLDLSSLTAGDPNFLSLNASQCVPQMHGTAEGSGHINADSTKDKREETIEWRYTLKKCTSSVSSIFDSEPTKVEMAVVELEATSCADGRCRKTFSAPIEKFGKSMEAVQQFIAESAQSATEEELKKIAQKEKIEKWSEKVDNCEAEWKDDDDHSKGIKKLKVSDATDCYADKLVENDFDDEDDAFKFYRKNLARALERKLLSSNPAEREEAMEILERIRDADISERITGFTDAMYGYGFYDQQFKDLVDQFFNGEISRFQMDWAIQSLATNARYDFMASSNGFSDQSALREYQYWQNAVFRNARYMISNTELAYNDINNNGRISVSRRDRYVSDLTDPEHYQRVLDVHNGSRGYSDSHIRLPNNPPPRNMRASVSRPRA